MAEVYVELAEFKERYGIKPDLTVKDGRINRVLTRASRSIDKHCGRRFYADDAATARRYRPTSSGSVRVDDFHTTVGLVVAVDVDDGGTFGQVLTNGVDFELDPIDGVVDGESGWPFSRIEALQSSTFPTTSRRRSVRVTAKWGWAAVPADVSEATEIIAAELLKLGDAPLGVAGFGEFGVVRVRTNPKAAELLGPYVRDPILAA